MVFRPGARHDPGMTSAKKAAGPAVAAAGVLAATLAHAGAFGDDVYRGTRALLRNVGAYHDAILTVDDGARAISELKQGDQGERLVIMLTCQVITAGAKEELSATEW